MQKLRGTGSTFSTSGKPWYPFRGSNTKIAARNARLHRLLRNGTIKPLTKDEARKLCVNAIS